MMKNKLWLQFRYDLKGQYKAPEVLCEIEYHNMFPAFLQHRGLWPRKLKGKQTHPKLSSHKSSS